jgi:hypothetical protein
MLALDTQRDAPALAPHCYRGLVEWLRQQAKANEATAIDASDAWCEHLAFEAAQKLREAADIIERAV